MKLDLHIHSKYSPDSKSSVADIIGTALKAGLQGISITDHNNFAGSEEALKIGCPDLIIIPGAEYSTDIGHLLVYYLREGLEKQNLRKDSAGRYSWKDILPAAREQDALVFLAHPYKNASEYGIDIWDKLDGIEVYNSRLAIGRNMEANKKALEAAARLKKAYSAGSDGHWLGEIGRAFWEYEGAVDIKEALKTGKGRVWGSPAAWFHVPASQILKAVRHRKLSKLPRPLVKMAYSLMMEGGRISGISKRPLGGWFDINIGKEE